MAGGFGNNLVLDLVLNFVLDFVLALLAGFLGADWARALFAREGRESRRSWGVIPALALTCPTLKQGPCRCGTPR